MGQLYLIPTPIGNPGDITKRALDVLGQVSLLACEDTRTTRRLLHEHGVKPPKLVSYTEHNKTRRIEQILQSLADSDVGLVSEAGMPGISDPGQELVAAAISGGYRVSALPGPAAPIAALAASGLPTKRFLFLGFLPRARGARRKALGAVADMDATLIVFESPRRVRATLEDIATVLGDREVVAAREISKVHEEFIRGRVSEVLPKLENPLGEFTLVIRGQREKPTDDPSEAEAAARRLAATEELSTRDIVQRLQHDYGMSRRQAYAIASTAKGGDR